MRIRLEKRIDNPATPFCEDVEELTTLKRSRSLTIVVYPYRTIAKNFANLASTLSSQLHQTRGQSSTMYFAQFIKLQLFNVFGDLQFTIYKDNRGNSYS